MLRIRINNSEFFVNSSLSVLEVCQYVGIHIPRFCYHENVSIAGNCRMCLVEIEKAPKPVASCALPISSNMSVFTDSPLVKKARENIVETLLLNHPLDCPICDQGGECDLQDQAKLFGSDYSRFQFKKRVVEDKPYGSFVKTIMTRCIHCTRCVRFSEEIAGTPSFGTFNRGSITEIGPYTKDIFNSEISGNIIDLCPVGALTSKPYAFKARPWELKCCEGIDITDGLGTPVLISTKETEVVRIQPKIDDNVKNTFISDKVRFFFDSLQKNRIKSIYLNEGGTFSTVSWVLFFDFFRKKLSEFKSPLFLVNILDIKSLVLLKRFNNIFSFINIVTTGTEYREKLYNLSEYDTLQGLDDSKYCFLISTNLKLECTLLNTKLRIKFQKKKIDIISVGSFFINNYPVVFLNISPKKVSDLVEGRNYSSFRFDKVLIILGNSVETRFSKTEKIKNLLKKKYPASVIIKNELKITNNGFKFSNLNNVNSRVLSKSSSFFCVNLEDNIFSRKLFYLKSKEKRTAWFNSHGSVLASKFNFILPITSFFEDENLFINLEKKLKKTHQVFKTPKNILNFHEFLLNFKHFYFDKKYFFFETSYLFFIKESLALDLFLINNLSSYKKVDSFINNSVFVNKMPFKPLIKDFHIDSLYTKNSVLLTQRSREIRELSHNFF